MDAGHDLFDYAGLVIGILTFAAAVIGLAAVVLTLRQGNRQERVESGPYIRVDLAAPPGEHSDFEPPAPHHHDTATLVRDYAPNLSPEAKRGISAWFRNYQPHQLGVAFSITATFSVGVEILPMAQQGDEGVQVFETKVFIAYLENDKPVCIDLVRFPRNWRVDADLVSLSYFDLYDRKHVHEYGEKGTNALHGRLSATYDGTSLASVPEGRPRGRGVQFEPK